MKTKKEEKTNKNNYLLKFEKYNLLILKNSSYLSYISNGNEITKQLKPDSPIILDKFQTDQRIQLYLSNIFENDDNIPDAQIEGRRVYNGLRLYSIDTDTLTLQENIKNAPESLKNVVNTAEITRLETEIKDKLLHGKQAPYYRDVAQYIYLNWKVRKNHETNTLYKYEKGGYVPIYKKDIVQLLSDKFGAISFSDRQIDQIIGFLLEPIKRNYYKIDFSNGTLDTNKNTDKTDRWKPEQHCINELPKIKTSLSYTPNATEQYKKTDLYHENHRILDSTRWKWNEELFYICVGASCMAINELDRLIIIVGHPASRKSTLLSQLKRIFNYSELKVSTITENKRFSLTPAVGKDINIDDDLQDFRLTGIGSLNSFISGTGIEVEVKGINERLKLTGETTPIIWGASNTLPTVSGDGFKRRLLLLLADNDFSNEEPKKNYITDIINGKRDEELGLMLSYSIQKYQKYRETTIIDKEKQKAMGKEWDIKSYPVKYAIQQLYINNEELDNYFNYYKQKKEFKDELIINEGTAQIKHRYGEINIINNIRPYTKVITEVKRKMKEFYREGKIFENQLNYKTKTVQTILDNMGIESTYKRYKIDDYGNLSEDKKRFFTGIYKISEIPFLKELDYREITEIIERIE